MNDEEFKAYLEWDRKQTDERIEYFNHLNRKYGIQFVSAETIYRVFEEIVQPTQLGFLPIRKGVYAQIVNNDITHLLKLVALKGTLYTLKWGLSLSYVPHEWRKGLRWHKSFKSSQFDLFCLANEGVYHGADWRELISYLIQTSNGEEYLRLTTKTMWGALRQEVINWFSSTQTLQSVLQKADEQVKSKPNYHSPEPLLVYAFTLARLGELEKAKDTVAKVFSSSKEPLEYEQNLKLALEKIHITPLPNS